MRWTRLDGRRISDEDVIEKYSCGFDTEGGKAMLEELRVARKWNLTIEEFNEWMDCINDDWAAKYFHDIHCDCGYASHYDNILPSMGATGTAILERKMVRGSGWPYANV